MEFHILQHSKHVKKLKTSQTSLKKQIFLKSVTQLEKQKSLLQGEEKYRENLRPLYNQVYSQLKDFDENKIFADYEKFQEIKELKLKKENELKLLMKYKNLIIKYKIKDYNILNKEYIN